jgi:hypothetical protein
MMLGAFMTDKYRTWGGGWHEYVINIAPKPSDNVIKTFNSKCMLLCFDRKSIKTTLT